MRKKIIAGNWKMNKTVGEALALVEELKPLMAEVNSVDVVICPAYTALYAVNEALSGTNIALGAQEAFWKESGAYTSQISLPMLADVGVTYVILGHSETRGRFGVPDTELTPDLMRTFGESDAGVNIKTQATLAAGLMPVICVGETLSEKHRNETDDVIRVQVLGALAGVSTKQVVQIVFAYEPVWAIGTGETCAPEEADRVCGVVRHAVLEAHGQEAADAVRIQYGGSMKPDNAAELLSRPNIDGGLIGGASLKAKDFAAIIAAAG